MPGGMNTDGTDELSRMLNRLGEEAPDVAAKALYSGAGVVADAYRRAVSEIKTGNRRYHKEPGGRLPTPDEKRALEGATGISKFEGSGAEISTVVGIGDGYASVRGRQKAVKVIARSINSGTSFMKKQPVFRKASTTSRDPAQRAMIEKVNELMDKIIH